jgi:hypothetical protein
MTSRTASLLLMFVAALAAAGLVLALVSRVGEGSALVGAWLLPVIAALCLSVVLFVGRHYVLPPVIARSPVRAAVVIVGAVTITMTMAVVAVWGVVGTVAGIAAQRATGPLLLLSVWFGLLWAAFTRMARATAGRGV